VEAQLFDADLVATWQHPYFAALNALAAFKSGRNLSNSVAVESALYASAQRQIKKALSFIGVRAASRNVAVLVVGGDAGFGEGGFEVLAAQMGGNLMNPSWSCRPQKSR
jgi:tRNA threonylcarbamoyladenosine modification (KEOPS) complex Cgi121 subunit